MLNVQKYLENKSFQDLEEELGIIINYYDDRIVLNYSQLSSPKFHRICDECRSLILNRNTLKILSRSFDRFYNLNEGEHFSKDEFDIQMAQAQTKLDGSLINLYFDGENWQCATRKAAFGEGQTNKNNSFKSLVERALNFHIEDLNYLLTNVLKEYTIICEIVSPETRVVVPYSEYKLYILAIRNKHTGKYLEQKECDNLVKTLKLNGCNVDVPNIYRFYTLQDCIEIVKKLDPMDYNGEGFVLVDTRTQNRIKIKNPGYVQLHHLRENGAISNKNIALLVMNQDYQEYLNYFECDLEFFQPYIDAYDKMMHDITHIWEKNKNIESQKDFALQVKDLTIGTILFNLRRGFSLEEIFNNLNDKTKVRLIESYKQGK